MIITVHAKPASRRNTVTKLDENTYKIEVTAAPEQGKANEAIARALAEDLHVAVSRVTLTRGATTHLKQFEIK
jgi:uncharacterized protein YggU (UPF0235/DUF167 family)